MFLKSRYYYLLVFVLLTFVFIQACSSEEDMEANDLCATVLCPADMRCEEGNCVQAIEGTYSGLMSGEIELNGSNPTDTFMSNVYTYLEIEPLYQMARFKTSLDISAIFGGAPNTLVPEMEGSLNNQTLVINSSAYVYDDVATIYSTGTLNFDTSFTQISGQIEFTQDAIGEVSFTATKQ